MIKFIIVDDEPIAHRVIEGFANDLPGIELLANCRNAMQAMEYLSNNNVDLMFLDINMPKMKGFEFLRTLSNPPKVIITSAYEEFALEGFELNVLDYLVKPFSFERFVKAINKLERNTTKSVSPLVFEEQPKRLFLKGDKKFHQVKPKSILFIEALGSYTKVITKEGTIVTHEKISNYKNILPVSLFIRVHKSFIVAIDEIQLIEGNRIIIEEFKIPIGQTFKNNVTKLFNS